MNNIFKLPKPWMESLTLGLEGQSSTPIPRELTIQKLSYLSRVLGLDLWVQRLLIFKLLLKDGTGIIHLMLRGIFEFSFILAIEIPIKIIVF